MQGVVFRHYPLYNLVEKMLHSGMKDLKFNYDFTGVFTDEIGSGVWWALTQAELGDSSIFNFF